MSLKTILAVLAIGCLALTAGVAQADMFTHAQVFGDATSGVDSSLTYTHAVDFLAVAASGRSVNGVPFQSVLIANDVSSYSDPGGNWSITADTPGMRHTAKGTSVTGNIGAIIDDVEYPKSATGYNGHDLDITLNNLTVGQLYKVSIYGMTGDATVEIGNSWITNLANSESSTVNPPRCNHPGDS